jgi:fructuronate reductase
MSPVPLRRTQAPPPARLVHLGLGNFFRAHAAVYTDQAGDGHEWGIAAFAGRSSGLARRLSAQDGLYTLVMRGPDADEFSPVASVAGAYAGDDEASWLRCLRDPALAVVTLTITEYGYRDDRAAQRLVAGLAERRRADGGPLAIMSCDNLVANGAITARMVLDRAERTDAGLVEWIRQQVTFPSTMVDRITPQPPTDLSALVEAATGARDDVPVVTEPFSEWVIAGEFPAGCPDWHSAGAVFAADIEPAELRKLRLLNGAHSLLAYLGLARGRLTVADAIGDDDCRQWVERWWDEASVELPVPEAGLRDYRARLIDRWSNARIAHQLTQIAADGSQKLPVRVLPVLRLHRERGDLPPAAIMVITQWVGYLRRLRTDAIDADLGSVLPLVDGPPMQVARAVLDRLSDGDPALLEDTELISVLAAELS